MCIRDRLGTVDVKSSLRAVIITDLGEGKGICMFGTLEGKLGGFNFDVISGKVESQKIELTQISAGILCLKWIKFPNLKKTNKRFQYFGKRKKFFKLIKRNHGSRNIKRSNYYIFFCKFSI